MSGLRTVLALAFSLSTLLAGCVSLGDDAATAALVPAPGELEGTGAVFHAPGALALDALPEGFARAVGGGFSTGAGAAEPTIGVTSDGSIFITGYTTANAAGRRAPTILRSDDAGQTWTDVGPKVAEQGVPPITNDPYVYVDTLTDRVYMLDLIGTVCSVLQWTDDKGDSWTTNPLACGTPGGNDHQTMVAAKPRMLPTTPLYENVVYYCVNRVADTSCATSLDGGLTFTPLKTVFTGFDPTQLEPTSAGGFCGGLSGHLKSGPDGTVYLPRSYCGAATVAITKDDGLTWTTSVIDTQHRVDGHEVAVATDDENNVYASWQSGGLHYFAYSLDGASTWSAPVLITAPGVTATEFNAIAAGKAGHVAIAYIGSTVEGGYEDKPTGNPGLTEDILGQPELPEWDNATWNGYITIITGANTQEPVIQTVTVNDPADPLARGLCGHTRCNGMTDFIDLVIDAEGRPWASFVDVCHAECVAAEKPMSDGAIGLAGTILSGPALRGEETELRALLPQAE